MAGNWFLVKRLKLIWGQLLYLYLTWKKTFTSKDTLWFFWYLIYIKYFFNTQLKVGMLISKSWEQLLHWTVACLPKISCWNWLGTKDGKSISIISMYIYKWFDYDMNYVCYCYCYLEIMVQIFFGIGWCLCQCHAFGFAGKKTPHYLPKTWLAMHHPFLLDSQKVLAGRYQSHCATTEPPRAK